MINKKLTIIISIGFIVLIIFLMNIDVAQAAPSWWWPWEPPPTELKCADYCDGNYVSTNFKYRCSYYPWCGSGWEAVDKLACWTCITAGGSCCFAFCGAGAHCCFITNMHRLRCRYYCGNDYCEGWSTPYCKPGGSGDIEGADRYKSQVCHDKGCSGRCCYDNVTTNERKVEDCGNSGWSNNYRCSGDTRQRWWIKRGCHQGSGWSGCYDDRGEWRSIKNCNDYDGWTNDYRCSGDTRQRKYIDGYCSGNNCRTRDDWRDVENCNDYDGWTNDYRCSGDTRQRKYIDGYCSGNNCRTRDVWKNVENCNSHDTSCPYTSCHDDNTRKGTWKDYYCRTSDATCRYNTKTCYGDCSSPQCCLNGNCVSAGTCSGTKICSGSSWINHCPDGVCNCGETGSTCPSDCDTSAPTVDSLTVDGHTSDFTVTNDNSFTIAWTVSDSGGSNLSQVEVWRKTDSGSWSQVHTEGASGSSSSGSWVNSVSCGHTYQYGLHVLDGAGNLGTEPSTITATNDCCTSHAYYQCYNNDVYWYNSCGPREELKQDCQATCFPGVLGDGCEAGTYQCPAGSDICIGLQPCSPPQYTSPGTACECNTDEGTVLKTCDGSGNCLGTEEVCDTACGADPECQGLNPGDPNPTNPFKSCCKGGWRLPKWKEISP